MSCTSSSFFPLQTTEQFFTAPKPYYAWHFSNDYKTNTNLPLHTRLTPQQWPAGLLNGENAADFSSSLVDNPTKINLKHNYCLNIKHETQPVQQIYHKLLKLHFRFKVSFVVSHSVSLQRNQQQQQKSTVTNILSCFSFFWTKITWLHCWLRL